MSLEREHVLLKCENEQISGSFKFRGAVNAIQSLRPKVVVAGSSGNHGKALAFACQDSLARVVVVMSRDSSSAKRRELDKLGVRIVECDAGTEKRTSMVVSLAQEEALTEISSYDDPLVIAGQGTVGLELLNQISDVQTILIPVGGGGLLAGVLLAVKHLSPRTRVIGVEPKGGMDTFLSKLHGKRIFLNDIDTICDGARAQAPGQLTFPIVQALVDEIFVVEDEEVLVAMHLLARSGIKAEPTGALAVAGVGQLNNRRGLVAIISGGNIPAQEHAALVRRATEEWFSDNETESPRWSPYEQ